MVRPEPKPNCVHHSPARKIALRDELYNLAYRCTIEGFNETLIDIRNKNMAAMGYYWDGFTYQGVYYGRPIPKIQTPAVAMTQVQLAQFKHQAHLQYMQLHNQKLDASLVPAMDLLLAEREEIERTEGVMVRTILGTILNSAQAVGDYKRLLPSVLHPHLTEVEAECSCQVPVLSEAEIAAVKAKHAKYIGLIQRRQLIYLLVP